MKKKFISALVFATIILGVTANISHGQFPSQAQANKRMQGGIENIPGMNFTAEQKEKLKVVEAENKQRLLKILTNQQQEYVKSAVQAGRNPQEVIKSLNLSRQQKEELEGVQKWKRNQLFSILTNEQKQKLKQMMMQRQGGRPPF
jgi:Spy/CpxP family protein refolding chaperone